jgi:hypothetical protein
MSNFADNYRYSQVVNQRQLEHYGLPTGGVPKSDKPSRGQVPQRKAVKASTQQGPYPSMSQTPAHKPVGSRTASAAGSRAQSPAPLNRGGKSDLMKPLPQLPTPSTPRAPEPRPGSSSGWSFRGRKRTDSMASSGSSVAGQPRSRRGSISESVKEAGKWAKSKAGIIGMDPTTRELWLLGAIKNQEREVEQARRQDPSSRPVSQQKVFAQKLDNSINWSDTMSQGLFDAQIQERASREFRAKGYKQLHDKACKEASATGKPRPLTPEEAKLSPPRNSLNPQERIQARDSFGDGWDPEANPTLALSKSERFAMNLSRKLDAVKRIDRGRKDSNSSAMDFADSAPADAMFICSICDMPQDSYLKEGKCDACHVWTKNKGRS